MTIEGSSSQAAGAERLSNGHPLQIKRHGLIWSGRWRVENDQLMVTSGYGSRSRAVREAEDPSHAAEAVLGAIVAVWRTRKV
jgi:hypothetical protein